MKEKIAAVIIMFVIIIGVGVNTIKLEDHITALMNKTDEIDIESVDAIQEFNKLYNEYKNKESYLSITVSHDDLTNIEECFVETIGYLKIGNTENAEVVKSRLWFFLEHLKRLSGFNIDSII